MDSGLDPTYVALLGLAQSFMDLQPPNVYGALKCLHAVLIMENLNPMIEARTHLQIGNILKKHTKNLDVAQTHIEQAWYQSQKLPQIEYDVCFEAASMLANMYKTQGQGAHAKQVLQTASELSRNSSYWHIRMLFELAGTHMNDRDYTSAVTILGGGIDFAYMAGANYSRLLFMLSKAMLLLVERNFSEAGNILNQSGTLIDNWVMQNPHQNENVVKQQKEYLHIFYLVLQVSYYLMVGQVKTVKPILKKLQQSIQTFSSDEELVSSNPADNFQWLSKDHLCILVYLVTVMHSLQAGYMDKVNKYTEKAIIQIEKLKSIEHKPILYTFHVLLLEHVIQCRLVTGNKTGAIQELGSLCKILQNNPVLFQRHRAQLHTLLGLYSMSMNQLNYAETQLNAALRTSQERELWTFANLNLAIVYLQSRRQGDFMALLDRISPEKLPSQSHSLQAAAYYIQGLNAFFSASNNDSKLFLRETLKMANAEDLNRLTSCSLVLLGHIFLSAGNTNESKNMVNPAMQLASKIPDVNIQLWASAILKDLYRTLNDSSREQEGHQLHQTYLTNLQEDHYKATQTPEHSLIQWTDGAFPHIVAENTDNDSEMMDISSTAETKLEPIASTSADAIAAAAANTSSIEMTTNQGASTSSGMVTNNAPIASTAQQAHFLT